MLGFLDVAGSEAAAKNEVKIKTQNRRIEILIIGISPGLWPLHWRFVGIGPVLSDQGF